MKQEILQFIQHLPDYPDSIAYYDLSSSQIVAILIGIVVLALIGWCMMWSFVIQDGMGK